MRKSLKSILLTGGIAAALMSTGSPKMLYADVMPKFTDLVRNDDGSVRWLSQRAAAKYCRKRGMRLPTVREFAIYAQSLGALGISETPKEGYYPIVGTDAANRPDNFYFSHEGFQSPAGDIGVSKLWSSSAYRQIPGAYYLMFGGFGDLGGGYANEVYYNSGAVCIIGN